jgi:hypothetical protein
MHRKEHSMGFVISTKKAWPESEHEEILNETEEHATK